MELIEIIKLEPIKPLKRELANYRPLPKYEGLKLLDEKPFEGGTSIMYWM